MIQAFAFQNECAVHRFVNRKHFHQNAIFMATRLRFALAKIMTGTHRRTVVFFCVFRQKRVPSRRYMKGKNHTVRPQSLLPLCGTLRTLNQSHFTCCVARLSFLGLTTVTSVMVCNSFFCFIHAHVCIRPVSVCVKHMQGLFIIFLRGMPY